MMDPEIEPPITSRQSSVWRVFGRRLPRSEIVFCCQMLLMYVVAGVSLFNLSTDCGQDKFWVGLLCSVIGYCLPNPKIKSK